MSTIQVENIIKSFGSQRAVDGVTFEVDSGEIFGLLGPNGAGKTTTIRIILDIFKADSGRVSILGGPMNEEKKNRIGYLPEERGLYQEIKLEQCLVYLATLKGLSKIEATRRVGSYLERFDLAEHRKKKLKELSKGMQQKAQLIVTLVHEPEVLIIDEPFSALDPINTQMVKDLLLEERAKGRTVVLCTHQMHQVEELCDRIVLIDQGKAVLYGNLEEIRRRYAGKDLVLRTPSELPATLPGVASSERTNGSYHLKLASGASPQAVLTGLVQANITVEQFEIAMPTMDEIFIRVVTGESPDE
ncbi:MAG TPA: ATP-binding cassette domain-containing protein [Longilinea sp.]|nr:ATP-binding cassette domain-containing protein [Longilinea sp.]